MFDTAKALQEVNDATVRNAVVIELQESILTAREQQTALIERVKELEQQFARQERRDGKKQRYELRVFGHGAFAHALKPDAAKGEPMYILCTNCYERGIKSVLQSNGLPGRLSPLRLMAFVGDLHYR
jgi:hypothetical protein